jgi:hypothetical protein
VVRICGKKGDGEVELARFREVERACLNGHAAHRCPHLAKACQDCLTVRYQGLQIRVGRGRQGGVSGRGG